MKYYLYKHGKLIAQLTKPDQQVINELVSYNYSIVITNNPHKLPKLDTEGQ